MRAGRWIPNRWQGPDRNHPSAERTVRSSERLTPELVPLPSNLRWASNTHTHTHNPTPPSQSLTRPPCARNRSPPSKSSSCPSPQALRATPGPSPERRATASPHLPRRATARRVPPQGRTKGVRSNRDGWAAPERRPNNAGAICERCPSGAESALERPTWAETRQAPGPDDDESGTSTRQPCLLFKAPADPQAPTRHVRISSLKRAPRGQREVRHDVPQGQQ